MVEHACNMLISKDLNLVVCIFFYEKEECRDKLDNSKN